jgi:regulatory protein
MTSTGGERLATVTYLPGVHPASDIGKPSPPVPSDRKRDFDPISNVSMHSLARRGMSSSEMRDYLTAREFDADAIDAEIDRLEQVGLLDDAALGETLVRTLRERKGLGRSALNAELRRRKLDPDAIDAALEMLADDEFDRALALAVKRAPQLRVHDRDTAKRRLVAFLMRKGYSGSMAAAAADRVLSGGYSDVGEARTGPVFR